jgi:glycosyltransferase involved in cell wall biosynthesis
MNMDVSVVIPTYNGARFIREALESVFAQSVPPQEIILVDDASTDTTVDIVREIAEDSQIPLRLIELPTNSGGPAHPMNVGVDAAATDLICLVDQDDILISKKIEWHATFLRENTACPLVFGQGRVFYTPGEESDRYTVPLEEILSVAHQQVDDYKYLLDRHALYRYMITHRNFAVGASRISFRKSAWREVGGFSESYRICWDCDFSGRCCRVGDIGFIDRVVQHHRLHDSNVSSGQLAWLRESIAYRASHVKSPVLDVDTHDWARSIGQRFEALAYFEAYHGNPLKAFKAYLNAARFVGLQAHMLAGIAKILPHTFLSLLRRGTGR